MDHASGEVWTRARPAIGDVPQDYSVRMLEIFNNGNNTFSLCMSSGKLNPDIEKIAKHLSPRRLGEYASKQAWAHNVDPKTAIKKAASWRRRAKSYGFEKVGQF